MSRLYDRINRLGLLVPEGATTNAQYQAGHLPREVGSSVCISITNVADYYFEDDIKRSKTKKAGDEWNWSFAKNDFPNIAPPFAKFFMEFRVNYPEPLTMGDEVALSVGVLLDSHDIRQEGHIPVPRAVREHYRAGQGRRSVVDDSEWVDLNEEDGVRWAIAAHTFVEMKKGVIYGPTCSFYILVAPDGTNWMGGAALIAISCFEDEISNDTGMIGQMRQCVLYPALLAISFMHCKNVKLLDEPIPPKLAKAYQKRHGRPMAQYKTLEITPMKEVLRREGQSEALGLKKALHICRGHFAHYSEDRPLFGRVAGTFWKSMHIRGTFEEGAVVKDYKVNKPIKGRGGD